MTLPIANASVTQLFQIGVESNSSMGAVAATRRMQTWGISPSPQTAGKEIKQMGAKVAVGYVLNKEWASHKIDGTPSFGELPYLLSPFLGTPTITPLSTPTSTPATRWLHKPNPVTPDTLIRLSGELGNGTRDQSYPAMFGNELQLKFDRNDGFSAAGTFLSQALVDPFTLTVLSPTNQVWTWTVTGTPTAGSFTAIIGTFGVAISIPFNATATQIATLLNAYAAPYGASFSVTGAMPTGPIVITATGFLSQKNIANFTIVNTGLTGGTVASAITTPGVQVTPESIIQPISPALMDIFLDGSFGALGTTKLPDGISATITLSNRQAAKWRINSGDNGQLARPVETALKGTVELVAQDDVNSMAILAAMRANTQQFIRIASTGPSIDGTNAYSWNLDTAVNWTAPKEFKDQDGLWMVTWDGEITASAGWGTFMQSTLVNTLPSL